MSKLQTWPSYFLFVWLLPSPCFLQPNSVQFLLVLVPIHLRICLKRQVVIGDIPGHLRFDSYHRVHWRLADSDVVNLRHSLFHLILLNVINLESKTQGHSDLMGFQTGLSSKGQVRVIFKVSYEKLESSKWNRKEWSWKAQAEGGKYNLSWKKTFEIENSQLCWKEALKLGSSYWSRIADPE